MHHHPRRILFSAFLLCALLSLVSCVNCGPLKREGTFGPRPEVDITPTMEEYVTPEDVPFAVVSPNTTADKVCYGEEGTDEAVVASVNTTLLVLPRWIREAFLTSGWEMCVVSYDIAAEDYDGQYEGGQVYGSTSYKNRTIKIQNELAATANSPIHEMGHWFDSQLGYPSLYSEEFASLYEDEGELYCSTFGPSCSWDIHEFLAEGFWCYWRSPVALQKACPEFYKFLTEQLSTLSENYAA